MAAIPLTAKVSLPSVRLKFTIMPGRRVRLWLAVRIMGLAALVYGREIEIEFDQPEVTFDR